MKEKFYGNIKQTDICDNTGRYVEEIAIKGYTIVSGLFSDKELQEWREKIDAVYKKQEEMYGQDALAEIQELDMCRAPLLYDSEFMRIAQHPVVMRIVERILGTYFILNLQNAIINRPDRPHHQSSWHRDLPYQNWVISKPLAINALFAIDEFSEITGGTHIVPFTHKTEILPSDEYISSNKMIACVPAGSAIIFDSMLFHKAGENRSKIIRRAVNNLYTTPILKQQYDFPKALGGREEFDLNTLQFLGYTSQVPMDDLAWRNARSARLPRKAS